MKTTLRGGLSDLVNELNKLRNNIGDSDQQDSIQKILRILFMLWEEVIYQQIDSNTSAYETALSSLGDAEKAAKYAIEDIGKVADAINSAAKAAKAVDKVVNIIANYALA